ncbi:hypothetical protein Cni_G14166 [Canna indica]|uniref:Uncharacterized protein n=1 Tax=Canna indica TaxID=4628 RepID=A0AAQ3KBE6_9LILI|nr:hypothetical protein Cni_G14166 [Canna indica]
MLAGLQIFLVDRKARFKHLKKLTDQVRQIKNSFPFGSCVMRTNIDNEDFIAFLVDNFIWAVFGNELKWY